MKGLLWLACIAGVAYGAYRYVVSPGCGKRGAVACPPAELEEGVGVTLRASEVCPTVGYVCVEHRNKQIARWPLDKGKLKVNVPQPEFASAEDAQQLRAAAIEGIMAWDGHPFPIVIDAGKLPFWDVRVVWTQGLYSEAGGVAHTLVEPDGKRIKFSVNGIAVVVPPSPVEAMVMQGMPREIAATLTQQIPEGNMRPGGQAATLARVKAVATHEMGHALGLLHSDSEDDIMYPMLPRDARRARASARDYRSMDALYTLPNGALLQ